jgi:uncharacterized membrane protein
MNVDFKFYGVSFMVYLQYFMDLINPILSFILLSITILYTYEKYLNIKNQNKKK